MEYKDFLTKLGKTALRYAELPMNSEDLAEEVSEVNDLGKTIDQAVRFDDNGDWTFSTSFYCPVNLDATAFISEASSSAVFDITLDTNYSQHFNFNGKHSGDSVSLTIKTNTFSKTKITIKIHCNEPKSTAKLHLSCNL